MTIHVEKAVAAEMWVLYMACTAMSLAARAEPPLKPNQPILRVHHMGV